MNSPWDREIDPDDPSAYAPWARDHGASGRRRAPKLDAGESVDLDALRPAHVEDLGPDDGVRVPRSLKPTLLRQDWTTPRRRGPFGMFGRFAGACVIAAAVAFVVGRQLAVQELAVQEPSIRSGPIAEPIPVVASHPPAPPVIERTISIPRDRQVPDRQVPDRQAKVPAPQLVAAQTAPLSEWAAPGTVPEPALAERRLDANEITSLLKRGEQFVAQRDLAAARSLFERAAEAGDARAAFALAETYDPIALQRWGEQGFASDIAMARAWYERAREFGSGEASLRLQMLARQDD